MAKRYSQWQIEQAVELRESGLTYRAIGNQLGMHPGAVAWHCLMLGADTPQTRHKVIPLGGAMVTIRQGHQVRRFTHEEDAKMIEMDLAGARIADICRTLGRRQNSVTGRLATLARRDNRSEVE